MALRCESHLYYIEYQNKLMKISSEIGLLEVTQAFEIFCKILRRGCEGCIEAEENDFQP